MGNSLHKIIPDTSSSDEKIHLLVQEVNRLEENKMQLEAINKALVETVSHLNNRSFL